MSKKETAEQKLLKMLETTSDTQAGNTGSPVSSGASKTNPSNKKSFLSILQTANKILVGVLLVLVLFLVNEVMAGTSLMKKKVTFPIDKELEEIVQRSLTVENFISSMRRPFNFLSSVNHRNIFQPFEEVEVKNVVEVSDKNRRVAQQTKNLRLVGVSWLDSVDTASVMIEDVEKKTTYFLMKGEKIGDVTVKSIYADSVELDYENEEIIIQYDNSRM